MRLPSSVSAAQTLACTIISSISLCDSSDTRVVIETTLPSGLISTRRSALSISSGERASRAFFMQA